jgi:hypothetical protein
MSAEIKPFAPAAGVTIQIATDGINNRVFRDGPPSEKLRDLLLAIAREVDSELAEVDGLDYGTRA